MGVTYCETRCKSMSCQNSIESIHSRNLQVRLCTEMKVCTNIVWWFRQGPSKLQQRSKVRIYNSHKIVLFPKSACEGFFVKSSCYIFTPSHLLIYIFTSSHLLKLHLHTFTSADLHLHILTSADLHLHTLTPADLHLHTFTSADLHLHTFTSADPRTFTSADLLSLFFLSIS